MRRWRVAPTRLDCAVADTIADHASPAVETPARVLTWLADEHILIGLSAGLWIASRKESPQARHDGDQILVETLIASIAPHILKNIVAQQRPDRRVHGRRHGIPVSGKPYDAFPSGHALHAGALGSAAARIFPRAAPLAWAIALGLSATRVLLLAHWLSDVMCGFALGIGIDRLLWAGRGVLRRAALRRGG